MGLVRPARAIHATEWQHDLALDSLETVNIPSSRPAVLSVSSQRASKNKGMLRILVPPHPSCR